MLKIGNSIAVRLQRIGSEQQPILIVDNVLDDPDAMIAEASSANWYTPEHTHYPGKNARLPDAYYRTVVTALRGPLEAAFGVSASAYLKYFGFFAMATTQAAHAEPIQKVPHHDSCDPERLSMIHYLCRASFGGTGFFRHLSTGYESISLERHERYVASVASELRQLPAAAGYAGQDSSGYELIGAVECVFNRLIVYRSHVLHSALLGNAELHADPMQGRLTANGFVEVAR